MNLLKLLIIAGLFLTGWISGTVFDRIFDQEPMFQLLFGGSFVVFLYGKTRKLCRQLPSPPPCPFCGNRQWVYSNNAGYQCSECNAKLTLVMLDRVRCENDAEVVEMKTKWPEIFGRWKVINRTNK